MFLVTTACLMTWYRKRVEAQFQPLEWEKRVTAELALTSLMRTSDGVAIARLTRMGAVDGRHR